jgi:uncharacterized protein (DUF433 family)
MERSMDWKEHIYSDPEVLVGKPIIRGTRLSVEFILELLGAGWTVAELLDNYPTLSPAAIQAVFAYAAECMRDEALYLLPAEH